MPKNIAELLDKADVNYCYYVKDNKSTIALAKFAIDKRDADSLAKSPHEHNIGLIFIYFFIILFFSSELRFITDTIFLFSVFINFSLC